jgi:hypothetical protein
VNSASDIKLSGFSNLWMGKASGTSVAGSWYLCGVSPHCCVGWVFEDPPRSHSHTELCVGLYITCPSLLSGFNQN